MHIIAYKSDYQGASSEIESTLLDIAEKSTKNNQAIGITGVLFLHNHMFLQVLEGAQDALERLMSHLQLDSRHKNIVRIIDEEILGRSFGNWSMDSFNLSDGESIDLRELTKIVDEGKQGLKINNDALLKFHKTMLKFRSLKNS